MPALVGLHARRHETLAVSYFRVHPYRRPDGVKVRDPQFGLTGAPCRACGGNGLVDCQMDSRESQQVGWVMVSLAHGHAEDRLGLERIDRVAVKLPFSQENVYRFSSKRLIGDPVLYYYGYRFYDTANQRWLNRDPIVDEGRVVAVLRRAARALMLERYGNGNLYAFALNDAVMWFDGNGMIPDGPLIPPPIGYDPRRWPPGALACSSKVYEESWEKYGGKYREENRDSSNRLGHCVASCRIARECRGGSVTSYLMGLGKETLDGLEKGVGRVSEGFDDDDMAANKIGLKFAGCPGDGSCEDQCKGALKNGSLYPE